MYDVINFDTSGNAVQAAQQEDLTSLGHLILILGCKSLSAISNISQALEFLQNKYGQEIKNLTTILLKKSNNPSITIDSIYSTISTKFMTEAENLYHYTDILEEDLSREMENGRLFRLLVKLGFINERPEFDLDPMWSETGDRYLLKLFRDYVFHQVYEDGNPVLDYAHVVDCLNKVWTFI